jgi:IS30 family transposase
MSYHQLTLEERYQIYAFKKAGFTQSQIACEIGVAKSTISRQLRRNRRGRGYRPNKLTALPSPAANRNKSPPGSSPTPGLVSNLSSPATGVLNKSVAT